MQEQTNITQEKIFELYGDYLLNQGEKPKNVYLFAKENNFEEKEFYHYFSGFDEIEREMLNHLFTKSLELVSEVNSPSEVTTREKLLNVYYIFFENLTMNRSLVLSILGNNKIQNIKTLQNLRETHKQFVNTLNFREWEMIEKAKEDIRKFNERSRQEVLWLHLVSAIDFWKKDTSADFEKTDIFIEKTIDTGFELIDNEPLRKVIDLGKFLWKEKFKMS
ncbi:MULTISPECIES: TetR family transcriptional regulator C-terminal domain-containing protein [Chryseobacterium]|uniref:TetR/AcrR family transcriptional regulator n=1 Tax=Chryseobacterium bernardetii TaxID=1241978 RepID=A0A3G6TBV3_9FLAO|nr:MULTISPECIES: TetR family transcriptional regulator C-terminal domain-containing protein [Chryseobacterium]AZB26722.1 TetR/AcrR family transcriptional regulator [Chryseobacterium bernardetii]AZB33203.1 TetR/AcrR family transcriptional regulator [Chryseobacterium bernardetii]UCA61012.1 TetR/AcrR family transcriptional regulator [Chryseobacterium rhizoplanae]